MGLVQACIPHCYLVLLCCWCNCVQEWRYLCQLSTLISFSWHLPATTSSAWLAIWVQYGQVLDKFTNLQSVHWQELWPVMARSLQQSHTIENTVRGEHLFSQANSLSSSTDTGTSLWWSSYNEINMMSYISNWYWNCGSSLCHVRVKLWPNINIYSLQINSLNFRNCETNTGPERLCWHISLLLKHQTLGNAMN